MHQMCTACIGSTNCSGMSQMKNHLFWARFGLTPSYSLSNTLFLKFLTAVNCGTLSNPANGQVSHTGGTTYGQTATYSCNTGYNRVGSHIRTCQATGVWSGDAPTCQGRLYHLFINCKFTHFKKLYKQDQYMTCLLVQVTGLHHSFPC